MKLSIKYNVLFLQRSSTTLCGMDSRRPEILQQWNTTKFCGWRLSSVNTCSCPLSYEDSSSPRWGTRIPGLPQPSLPQPSLAKTSKAKAKNSKALALFGSQNCLTLNLHLDLHLTLNLDLNLERNNFLVLLLSNQF